LWEKLKKERPHLWQTRLTKAYRSKKATGGAKHKLYFPPLGYTAPYLLLAKSEEGFLALSAM